MTYIIHYIIALTFSLLGWNLPSSSLGDNADVVSKCIQTDKAIEPPQINPDTFSLFRDFRIDLNKILTTNHAE